MKTLIDKKTKSGSLVLSDELTVAQAGAIREALSESLGKVSSLTVDITGASEVDLSFLQLMCSVHRTATKKDKLITLAGRSNKAMQKAVTETSYRRTVGCILDNQKNCLWVDKYHE
jgi:ABC-type transporter Mla MlaB component